MSPAQFLAMCYEFGILPNNGVTPPGVYVPVAGGSMTGNLNMTAGANIDVASGADVNLASGANLTVVDPVTLRNLYEYTDLVGNVALTLTDANEAFNCTVAAIDISDGNGLSAFTQGFAFIQFNSSGGDVTFTPKAGDLVNGASSLTIPSQQGALILACTNQWSAILSGGAGSPGLTVPQVLNYNFLTMGA